MHVIDCESQTPVASHWAVLVHGLPTGCAAAHKLSSGPPETQ